MLLTITTTHQPADDLAPFLEVGTEDETLGAPTRMAIFDAAG